MIKGILIGIFLLFLAAVGVAYLLPRQVHVERSAAIEAPQATVFALVNGYRLFQKWSPWADKDPQARYTHEGPPFGQGAKLSWTGDPKTVGTGSQTIVESRPYGSVTTALDFGAEGPATARFALSREGDPTRIVWSLDADLGMNPIGRYFGLMFDRMIGPDFEKGLATLAVLAESLPKTDFAGLAVDVVEAKPLRVAFVEASCGKDEQEIAAKVGAAYAEVSAFMKGHRVTQSGPPITINTRWDDSGYVFDAAIPVSGEPEGATATAARVKIKDTYAGPALKVVHRGAYSGMSATYDALFAWAAAHGYEQAGPPWDEYLNDPVSTPEADLQTNVFLPVR